ncbi:MAG: hypothetical protein AAF449_18950, partial [Myxococcota bacterium]
MTALWLISAAVLAAPGSAANGANSEDAKKAEAAIRQTFNSSAKAIDGCTERYLTARPQAQGQVRVDVKVK